MLLAANAFIVYFAIGVPFALLTIFVNRGRLEFQDLGRSFTNLTFWPLMALRSVYHTGVYSRSLENRNGDLNQLRTRLNEALSNEIPKHVKRDLILEFERFEALSRELEALTTSPSTPQPRILNAFRHPSPTTAAKCHSRRTIFHLNHHRKRSSDSLRMRLKDLVINDHEILFELTATLDASSQATEIADRSRSEIGPFIKMC